MKGPHSMSILSLLKDRFRVALADLIADPSELLELVRQSQDAKFGDYQANMSMPLGKRLGRPPREVAAEIVRCLDLADICREPEIAGPGFINLRLRDRWLAERLAAAAADPRLGVAPDAKPKTFVVDYSAPNVAKPMHVGHIRSTVIGDAICRLLRFLGHRAISDNHIGDWGTQFGMIIYGYKHFLDEAAYRQNPVEELARLYRKTRALMDERPEVNAEVLAETAKLHAGDAENRRLWKRFLPHCQDEINRVYRRLDVQFDHALGESFYHERLPRIVENLLERGIAKQSDGAICIFFDKPPVGQVCNLSNEKNAGQVGNLSNEKNVGQVCNLSSEKNVGQVGNLSNEKNAGQVGNLSNEKNAGQVGNLSYAPPKTPMIVRKSDGAFLYGTTDLATLEYRMANWRPDVILYVVDHRQSLHFQQLFAAARMLGFDKVDLQHVSFGTVLGDDNRPFRTRSGDTVGLEGLLDEAVRRALEIVSSNDDAKPGGPELSAEQRRQVAETVGIAALKYADLSQNRTSDYVFSYDKMLAMTGNTATYMQYAYARVRSIFARGNVDVESLRASAAPPLLDSPAERALALELLQFGEALDMAAADYRPNQLTSYLFDLANRYSTFFEQCHVLRAESDELRQSRLLLCDLTARTIQKGLELLGINVVEKM